MKLKVMRTTIAKERDKVSESFGFRIAELMTKQLPVVNTR